MNLTKLTNAEYTLQSAREAIDGDNATKPSDPTAYYTATGNPPGYWIGSAATLVGGTPGTTASSKTVRTLINERRNPVDGQYLGDVDMSAGDNGEAPVAGWDLTTRQPKSVSVLWAFGDSRTRQGIDECMDRAAQMTIEYLEREYATTRAGQGGVASVSADGVAGFVFDHYDTRDGDPQPHKHIVISNRVRRSSDKTWTALDGRKIYAAMVEVSEVHENLLQDLLTERFGWSWTLRRGTDTKSMVNEVDGVPQELIDAFSGRHAEIARTVERRIKEEEHRTGRTVGPKRKAQIDLEVWKETRRAKPEIQPSLEAKRAHWYRKLGQAVPDVRLDRMWKDVDSRRSDVIRVSADCEDDIARLLLDQLADLDGTAGGADEWLDLQARAAIRNTSHAHTVWKRTNVRAEAQRLLRGVRIDPEQRVIVANSIADRALEQCVKLTPDRYRLPDGAADDLSLAMPSSDRNVFEPADLDMYTTTDVLDAEREMIAGLDKATGVCYEPGQGERWLDQWNRRAAASGGHPLADDQKHAAAYVLENPRLVSSIIGPAGTGKTTTMNAVAQAWQARYGAGSVLGLATSRKAVGELRASIGCESMTIAKLMTMNSPERGEAMTQRDAMLQQRLNDTDDPLDRHAVRVQIASERVKDSASTIRANQLIIVDEAGMVDTRYLQQVTRMAELRGAKVILTGDPRQLDSVSGAGGMLGYADRHDRCARLTSLWRFTSSADKWANDPDGPTSPCRWEGEADATLLLREGGDRLNEADVARCRALVDEYDRHERIHWGEDMDMEEESYRMCVEWQQLGKSTLLIAGTNAQVRDLNERFILERRAQGMSESNPARLFRLRDGLSVGTGDQIVCRENSPQVRARDGRTIENAMTFSIVSTGAAGARCVNLSDGSVWKIPRAFLLSSCEAGYASTVHRSQGMTVDRCAAMFPSNANPPCNLQYVAGTRGKEENHFLFGCKSEEARHVDHLLTGAQEDPREIALSRMLDALLTRTDTLTAVETSERERMNRHDLRRLLREHDYAAGLISGPHLLAMLSRSHDAATVAKIKHSPSFEWLRGVWSRAYMTDARRAMAIISQDLPERSRKLTSEKSGQVAVRAARALMPEARTETGDTFTLFMDADDDAEETLMRMMGETGIPFRRVFATKEWPDGFTMDERYTPALKALLDARMQTGDGLDQSMFPGWPALRDIARRTIERDPDMARKAKPLEPDWAATIAGRLNAGLLDRANGSVHDDWIGGVVPPIRASKRSAALDMVRQNERLIERKTLTLEQEARQCGQAWVERASDASRNDPHLLRDIAVYRAMWTVDDPDLPLGDRPPTAGGRQEQHWANLNGRINHTATTVTADIVRKDDGPTAPTVGKAKPRPVRPHVEGRLLDSGVPLSSPSTSDGDRLLGRCSRDVGFLARMCGIADEAALDFVHGGYDPAATLDKVRSAVGDIASACGDAFGEELLAYVEEASETTLDALVDPINGRIARLSDHRTGEPEITSANRADRVRRLREYYMDRATLDWADRARTTYSLLPPTIRQSLDALTMTYGGDATDLMGTQAMVDMERGDEPDHGTPTWDEVRECSNVIEEYFEAHTDTDAGTLPDDVERSLLALASMYGMGRDADRKELETMRTTLRQPPVKETSARRTMENSHERTTAWQR